MKTSLVNMIIEWKRAPAAFRLEIDHAEIIGGGINVGWGTHDRPSQSFTFTSTDEMCRVTLGLKAEGTQEEGIRTVVRVVDTDHPFRIAVDDVLKQEGGELAFEEVEASVYAEVDWFAML